MGPSPIFNAMDRAAAEIGTSLELHVNASNHASFPGTVDEGILSCTCWVDDGVRTADAGSAPAVRALAPLRSRGRRDMEVEVERVERGPDVRFVICQKKKNRPRIVH